MKLEGCLTQSDQTISSESPINNDDKTSMVIHWDLEGRRPLLTRMEVDDAERHVEDKGSEES